MHCSASWTKIRRIGRVGWPCDPEVHLGHLSSCALGTVRPVVVTQSLLHHLM